jgi:uncharacterized protein (TIGR03067 family)
MRITAILLAMCLIGSDARADKEPKNLQGEWATATFEANGESVPTKKAGWKVIVQGPKVSVKFGMISFTGSLAVDSSSNPKKLDLTGTNWEGSTGAWDVIGIYKLEGSRLTVCYRLGSAIRPSEFRTQPGSDLMIQVFERIK